MKKNDKTPDERAAEKKAKTAANKAREREIKSNAPELIERMSRDLAASAATMSRDEARYLVDAYYQMQDSRIRAQGQLRAGVQEVDEPPHATLGWLFASNTTLENQVKRALDIYSTASEVGRWSRSIVGIGPVIAAGLIAHIDIEKCPTVGHIWSFAGLNPTRTWAKGEKRPWNAELKTLCWKIGESFVKVKGNEADTYGKIYDQRKAYELARNERGEYAQQAQLILEAKRFKGDTKAKGAYEKGRLPDGHVHARAKRYAVKLFLAHWHEVAYRAHFGTSPPLPYAIAILGHAHHLAAAA